MPLIVASCLQVFLTNPVPIECLSDQRVTVSMPSQTWTATRIADFLRSYPNKSLTIELGTSGDDPQSYYSRDQLDAMLISLPETCLSLTLRAHKEDQFDVRTALVRCTYQDKMMEVKSQRSYLMEAIVLKGCRLELQFIAGLTMYRVSVLDSGIPGAVPQGPDFGSFVSDCGAALSMVDSGDALFESCNFAGNKISPLRLSDASSVLIKKCSFTGNKIVVNSSCGAQPASAGVSMHWASRAPSFRVTSTTFTGNEVQSTVEDLTTGAAVSVLVDSAAGVSPSQQGGLLKRCFFSANEIRSNGPEVQSYTLSRDSGLHGGAIRLRFTGHANDHTVNISQCEFNDCRAVRGGAISASFENQTTGNRLVVSSSQFSNNSATEVGETCWPHCNHG